MQNARLIAQVARFADEFLTRTLCNGSFGFHSPLGVSIMAWRSTLVAMGGLLFGAAFLLLVPNGVAGEHVRAGDRMTGQNLPASASIARAVPVTIAVAPVTISVAVTTPSKPATVPIYVNLRGPDGQLRRFPVEGGHDAIQSQPVIVLRPGQSVTIQTAVK
jgi:hypothetical protein